MSACNGHIEVVSKLLEEGIDVNATLEVSVNTSSWFLNVFMLPTFVHLYRLYRIIYTVYLFHALYLFLQCVILLFTGLAYLLSSLKLNWA